MSLLPFVLIAWLFVMSLPAASESVPGDARRGEQIFREQHCITCHSIRGEGGKAAPDLGQHIGRDYTPSGMASLMWNHAPAMWAAMEQKGIKKPRLTEAQAADLFAYFHSTRFFEKPGDAGRGRQVFVSKHCAECHGLSAPLPGGAPAVAAWQSLTSPIALAQQMWNHAPQMWEAMAHLKIRWPEVTASELTDLLVYAQNLPQTRTRPGEFVLDTQGEGAALFEEKGCADCHQGKLAMENLLTNGTLTSFAAEMWNHAPLMQAYGRRTGRPVPTMQRDEMRQVVGYLWYKQLFAETGSVARGRRVFVRNNCAVCHYDPSSGAPDLKQVLTARKDPLRPFSMVAVVWQHGPAMQQRMMSKNLRWPRFSQAEMVDLISYLNSVEFRGASAHAFNH